MKDVLDLHTHTIASGHAYNTMNEMIQAALNAGLEIYGITEHAPRLNGSCGEMYFQNLKVIPRERFGITTLFGAELNILDVQGNVDLPKRILAGLDLGIASLHIPCYQNQGIAGNTRAYLNAMKNTYVNIIGHPDDARFPVDYKELVLGAKEYHVLLEVNNASLSPGSFRENPREAYYEMLDLCREYQVPVILDSDAHVDASVGDHSRAYEVLQTVDFPEELVVNGRPEMLKEYLNYYR